MSEGRMGWSDQLAALGTDSLDAAWAAAEAALPDGWWIGRLVAASSGQWRAVAYSPTDYRHANGPTPAASLRGLAAKLRADISAPSEHTPASLVANGPDV